MKYINLKKRKRVRNEDYLTVYLGVVVALLVWSTVFLMIISNSVKLQIALLEERQTKDLLQIEYLERRLKELQHIREFEGKVSSLSEPFSNYGNMETTKLITRRFLNEFDEETTATALLIVARESRFDALADNTGLNDDGSNDKGCWQINSIHEIPDEKRLDCEWSTEWAIAKVKADGGFGAWAAYWNLIAEGKIRG